MKMCIRDRNIRRRQLEADYEVAAARGNLRSIDLFASDAQAEEISWELNSCSCSGKIAVTESSAVIGGGSLPGETMPDYAVEIFPEKETAQQLADRLRLLPVPIVSHIKNDRVLLEMRTISEEEKREFTAELKEVLDEK